MTIIQKRWKSIRTCYAREIQKKKEVKSGSGAKAHKQYVYFEQLSFLETLCKKTASTLDHDNDRENSVEGNNDNTDATGSLEVEGISKSKSKSNKKLRKDEDNLIEILKKKIVTEEETHDEKHEDKLFLLSLVSEINKVPPERRLKLRSDIIAAIAAAQTPITQQWAPMPNTGQFGYQQYSLQPQSFPNSAGYSYQAQHYQSPNHQQHPSPSPSYLNPTGFSNQIKQCRNPNPLQHTSTPKAIQSSTRNSQQLLEYQSQNQSCLSVESSSNGQSPVASPAESDSSSTQISDFLLF